MSKQRFEPDKKRAFDRAAELAAQVCRGELELAKACVAIEAVACEWELDANVLVATFNAECDRLGPGDCA